MRTKKPNFDIRRPVKLKKAVTGTEIAKALKKMAKEEQIAPLNTKVAHFHHEFFNCTKFIRL